MTYQINNIPKSYEIGICVSTMHLQNRNIMLNQLFQQICFPATIVSLPFKKFNIIFNNNKVKCKK